MKKPVLILVATMSGTAEMVAEELAEELTGAGRYAPQIKRMETVSAAQIAAAPLVVVCTSTYGLGEVPDNGKKLYAELRDTRPDLSAVRYGIFGLGDREHHGATFCNAAKRFDALLQSLGAQRLGPIGEHDCRSRIYPEEQGRKWVIEWMSEEASAA